MSQIWTNYYKLQITKFSRQIFLLQIPVNPWRGGKNIASALFIGMVMWHLQRWPSFFMIPYMVMEFQLSLGE